MTASRAARRGLRDGGPRLARRVRANLERVRERIGRTPVEICAAIKYVDVDELPALAEAGIKLVGENRAQELIAKQDAHGDLFEWDFIGALQSSKVQDVAPRVRLIHSLASESALAQLEQHPAGEILVQVNVAGEEGKAGIAPAELGGFIARSPVPRDGPDDDAPAAERPEDSRPHFARLAELAAEHGLERLSMGTTQDYEAAVAEGATIVRLGSVLYELSRASARSPATAARPARPAGPCPRSSTASSRRGSRRAYSSATASGCLGSASSRLPTTSAGTSISSRRSRPVERLRARHDAHRLGERLGMAVALDRAAAVNVSTASRQRGSAGASNAPMKPSTPPASRPSARPVPIGERRRRRRAYRCTRG